MASEDRVLLVDDQPMMGEVVKRILATAGGIELRVVSQPAEALAAAREFLPTVILQDIEMPGMNGFQATRALVNDPDTSRIPIVMVTSKNQETDRIWGLRQGAVDYMVKPVSPAQLVQKAQATLAA